MRRLDANCAGVCSLPAAGTLRVAFTLVLIGLLTVNGHAGTIWDGGGSDDNWTNGFNWNPAIGMFQFPPPNNGTAIIVMPAVTGLVQTPIVNTPQSINSLTFNSDGGNGRFVILGAAELTVGTGGITNNDADMQSFFGTLKLSANQPWTAAAGPLQMDAVNLDGYDLTMDGSFPITLGNLISGNSFSSVILANSFTSTVTMSGSGNNTYAGGTFVENGALILQKGGEAVPEDLAINAAGTVRLAANEQISHAAGNLVQVFAGGLLDVNTRTETLARLIIQGGGSVSTAAAGKLTAAEVHVAGAWTNVGDLYIGDVASGTLNILAGGDVSNADGSIGYQTGSTGAVTVNGSGSSWNNSGRVVAGYYGSGTLNILAGGDAGNANGIIGYQNGSTGAVTVDGMGSTWTNSGALYVGYVSSTGDATLDITNGGTVTVAGSTTVNSVSQINVSNGTFDAVGDLTIDGGTLTADAAAIVEFGGGTLRNGAMVTVQDHSELTATGTLYMESDVAMHVNSGATYNTSATFVGTTPGPAAELIVDGADTVVTSAHYIDVGYGGTGAMTVTGGARVEIETGTGAVGSYDFSSTGSVGTLTLDGTDASGNPSSWLAAYGPNMGLSATSQGTISILNGALLRSTNGMNLGESGSAQVFVDGADGMGNASRLDVGTLTIVTASSGSGELIASAGGYIDAGNVFMAPMGGTATLTITGADSTLGQSGASILTVGNATTGTAALNVLDGGVVNSGTGAIMINTTGTMLLDGAASAGTFNANGDMTVHGSVQIGDSSSGLGGVLNINAGLMIDGGTVHLSSGSLDAAAIEFASGGTFDFNGGTLHVDDFQNNLTNEGGTLAPGHSAGHTDIAGNYTQLGAATLGIEISGVVPGQWDTISVTGNAILDGTIQVALLNGLQPVIGNSFTILSTTFGNIGGSFDTELFPVVNGVTFVAIYNPQNVVLRAVAVPLPGDYNQNGKVDAADYVLWRKSPGTYGGNPAGYNTWRANFGQPAGSGSSAGANGTVPEPATLMLLMFAAAVRYLRRSRPA